MSQTLENLSSDIVHKIMECLELSDIVTIRSTCKNLKSDTETFSKKIKKEELETLVEKHKCRHCDEIHYLNSHKICTYCFLHMCQNCFTIRNHISEFNKVPEDMDDLCYGYKAICHDFCVFRCHKCKFYDDRYELFLNDDIDFKSICMDCFHKLDDSEKYIYSKPTPTDTM